MIFNRGVSGRALLLVSVLAGMVLVVVLTSLYLYQTSPWTSEDQYVLVAPDVTSLPPPTPSVLGRFSKAAVVSNGLPCAEFGKQMLEKGGSAVDAAIATLLCDGATCLHNMGLGGGFLMTIYNKTTGTVETLNARETAPAAATEDMFHGNITLSTIGGLSIAVPGELRGYQAAWERYGRLKWHKLFEPTIQMCEEGVPIGKHLAKNLEVMEQEIRNSKTLSAILLLGNGELPKFGETIKLPLLAKTLRRVAYSPLMADELYNGGLTEAFISDIKSAGGIITAQDLADYRVKWQPPIKAPLSNNLTLYSMPPPGSGLLLGFMLQLLDGFVTKDMDDVTVVQRITEAFKHAYGRRTDIGDPHFSDITQVIKDLTSPEYIMKIRARIQDNKTSQDPRDYGAHYVMPEDHGTANIVVVSPEGDAVAATSTVNLLFGSQFASLSTGIILNDEMDDFSAPAITNYFGVPPSPANFIAPGKRPMSSMCPSLIIDGNGDVRLAIGAAGGTKITTSTALVTILNLWFDKNIKEAIDYPRFHHQLEPMIFAYEYGLTKDVVDGMKSIGHVTKRMPIAWRSCVTAIARNGTLTSNSDNRRPGCTSGF
ncbi:scoloptoxin SSD14-like isoform X2 [Macrosteles quadrilineatus]|uniref:scoloptoxin SSD14-like isoform X2 n=1 Tax=Macrosteles quadrilineatus TaxID=74068 RepID=UPI0023E1D49A|nr:scoloptoxin SSD14-like isoform X2 [Macrosteles quadrilineatus]